MLFWSIGKFKVVELGYMTPRGSLENLGPKEKGERKPELRSPVWIAGLCLVWWCRVGSGLCTQQMCCTASFLFLSAPWTETSKERGTATWGFTAPKVVVPFHPPTQDPGFPTESSVPSLD